MNKAKLVVENVPYELELLDDRVIVNGHTFPYTVKGDTILIGDNPHTVAVKGSQATVDGIGYPFEAFGLEEPKQAKGRRSATAAAADDAGAVTAIMPGLIIKVLKAEGDRVKEGEVVVILEAMKMQNELQARRAGVVKKLHVKAGDKVEMRQILMTIEA